MGFFKIKKEDDSFESLKKEIKGSDKSQLESSSVGNSSSQTVVSQGGESSLGFRANSFQGVNGKMEQNNNFNNGQVSNSQVGGDGLRGQNPFSNSQQRSSEQMSNDALSNSSGHQVGAGFAGEERNPFALGGDSSAEQGQGQISQGQALSSEQMSSGSLNQVQSSLNSSVQNSSLVLSQRREVEEIVEEVVEKILDENTRKTLDQIKKVLNWKEKVDNQIATMKEDIVNLKDGFDRLEKRILGKINDYDRNIVDVNSEIKALEKVFQKITPTLVNNVNELSKIAKDLKSSKSSESGSLESDDS